MLEQIASTWKWHFALFHWTFEVAFGLCVSVSILVTEFEMLSKNAHGFGGPITESAVVWGFIDAAGLRCRSFLKLKHIIISDDDRLLAFRSQLTIELFGSTEIISISFWVSLTFSSSSIKSMSIIERPFLLRVVVSSLNDLPSS